MDYSEKARYGDGGGGNVPPPQVFCPNCRGGNPPSNIMCMWCGRPLAQTPQQFGPPQQPYPPNQPQYQGQYQGQYPPPPPPVVYVQPQAQQQSQMPTCLLAGIAGAVIMLIVIVLLICVGPTVMCAWLSDIATRIGTPTPVP
jgi:hypothetical protein